MKISIILAHPDNTSFNHAIAMTAAASLEAVGHDVAFHDLYKEKFDPILKDEEAAKNATLPPEIAVHCHEIAEAEGIIVVHPNWWGQPPAILKGWVDRVIRPGIAYEFLEGDQGEGIPKGLLKAKTAVVFNTSNTSVEREKKVFGDPLERLWKECIFEFCGVAGFHRRMFTVMVTSSKELRQSWLEEVEETVVNCFSNI